LLLLLFFFYTFFARLRSWMMMTRKHDASSIHSFRVGGVVGNDRRQCILRALFVPGRKSFKEERKKKFSFLDSLVNCSSVNVLFHRRGLAFPR